MTYGPANPENSYYRDLLMAAQPNGHNARARLQAHANEVQKEAEFQPTSVRGKVAVRSLREANRGGGESRAVSTQSGSDAALTPPIYLETTDLTHWRTFGRTFIDKSRSYPMPSSGMTFNVPKITTAPTSANQTQASGTQGNNENNSVSTTDFVSSWQSGVLQTIVANNNVSQQFMDRIAPGLEGDVFTYTEQQGQVNKSMDQYALGVILGSGDTPLSGVGVQTYTDSAFTAAKFKQKVHRAKAAVRDTDGTIGYPDSFIADASLWEEIEGAYDTANRPLVVPREVALNPIAVGDNTTNPEGFTGFSFAGVDALIDHNLWILWNTASVGGSASAQHVGLLGDLQRAGFWLEGSPVNRVLPQPNAASLEVLIQTYVYCAYVVVWPAALQLIYGTGTQDSFMV